MGLSRNPAGAAQGGGGVVLGGLQVLEGVLVFIPSPRGAGSTLRGAGGQGKAGMELGAHGSQGCRWRQERPRTFRRVWVVEVGFVLGKICGGTEKNPQQISGES